MEERGGKGYAWFEWQEGKTGDEKINGGVLGFPFFLYWEVGL